MKLRSAAAALFVAAISIGAHSATAATPPLTAQKYADFDSYVLALSWQSGFCQSMSERYRKIPTECRHQSVPRDKTQLLTVHGLWPGLPASVASRGVDEKRWMRFGCATRPVPNFPEARGQKCSLPAANLSNNIAQQLGKVMPAAGGGSCLERYEYAKHGACFGFDPNAWFGTMVRLNQEVRQSLLGAFLAEHYGKTVTRKDLNNAVAQSWGKENVKAVRLSCHGNPSYLTEVQLVLKSANINQPLDKDSFVPQPRPGNCPARFQLDAVGLK